MSYRLLALFALACSTAEPDPAETRTCTVMPFSGDAAVQFDCLVDDVCVLHDDGNQLPTECVTAAGCDADTTDACACLEAAGSPPCSEWETCSDDGAGQVICE